MDTAGRWYQAKVCHRTYDKAFIHYNGWHDGWDEWINWRSGMKTHPELDHLAVRTYNRQFPAFKDDIDVLFPRLRTIGTWQPGQFVRSYDGVEGRLVCFSFFLTNVWHGLFIISFWLSSHPHEPLY